MARVISACNDVEAGPASRGPALAADRLYQGVARNLIAAIARGAYRRGGRLPAERELAAAFGVSRPTVREAIIAREVQRLVEVRVGSGAYVRARPGATTTDFGITVCAVTEARLVFEADAAALAAQPITDAELELLLVEMALENASIAPMAVADQAFDLAIARAAVVRAVDALSTLRSTSPECALLHHRARCGREAGDRGACRGRRTPARPRCDPRGWRYVRIWTRCSRACSQPTRAVAEARRSLQPQRDRLAPSATLCADVTLRATKRQPPGLRWQSCARLHPSLHRGLGPGGQRWQLCAPPRLPLHRGPTSYPI